MFKVLGCRFCFYINLAILYCIFLLARIRSFQSNCLSICFQYCMFWIIEKLVSLFFFQWCVLDLTVSAVDFIVYNQCEIFVDVKCRHILLVHWINISKIYRLNLLPFRRTKSLYGVMPNCKFGPCGSILDDSATSL